jgi:hypothetical protein
MALPLGSTGKMSQAKNGAKPFKMHVVQKRLSAFTVTRQELVRGESQTTHLPAVRENCRTPKLTIILIPTHVLPSERYNSRRLIVIFQRLGLLVGMLLSSMSFYYSLARVVMWAASL